MLANSSTNPLAPKTEDEHDPQFEPIIKLTEEVVTKTNEEDETVVFKLRSKLFRFDSSGNEWKERGTGEARLLQHKETHKIRLVMRREKTLKRKLKFIEPLLPPITDPVSADMRLQPNIGSDRSWVWKVAADYSEDPPTSETLANRFANADFAGQFKKAFEDARENNAKLAGAGSPPVATEEKPEEPAESDDESDGEGEAEGDAPAPAETNVPGTETGDSEKTGGE